MKFQIKNRWTGDVQFECELSAEIAGMSYGLQLGFAVKKARETGADLSGADLSGAVLRDADLSDADLSGAVLRDAVLRGAVLRGAVLRDADLRDADLSDAVLRGADLSDAVLRGAVLRDADLSGAVLRDADWIPRIANIHQAVYAAASKPNALDMESWHAGGNYCGTTHCRAGWVVVLAGEGGRVLEGCYGTPAAAALIYQASDPALERVPDFYCGNGAALEDMKRLADTEAEKAVTA